MSACAERALIGVVAPDPYLRGTSSSQSPLYSGRLSVGIRNVATLLLLSPPNPLRWALAGTPIKCLCCTDTAYAGKTVAVGPPDHHRTKQVGRHQAVYVRRKQH